MVNCRTSHPVEPSHSQQYPVTLGDRGRLVLPAELRKRLDLRAGDHLLLRLEADGSLRLIAARELARSGLGLFEDAAPGRDLAAELIAERRAEAARD